MAKIMTPETRRKIKETRDAQNAAFESQTITIDENWRIIRSDILNWEVQFKGQFWGYYGTVTKAFQALPGKMLSEEARGGVADVRSALNDIMERIEKAMKISSLPATVEPSASNNSHKAALSGDDAGIIFPEPMPTGNAGGEEK